jgi:hypothetical protein
MICFCGEHAADATFKSSIEQTVHIFGTATGHVGFNKIYIH